MIWFGKNDDGDRLNLLKMKEEIRTLQAHVVYLLDNVKPYQPKPVPPVVTQGVAVGSAYDNVKIETSFEVKEAGHRFWVTVPIQMLRELKLPHLVRVKVYADFGHRGTLAYFPDEHGTLIDGYRNNK